MMTTLPASFSTVPLLTIPAHGWSLDAFREWVLSDDFPDWIRASYLVDHVEIDMSPERPESHNKVKLAVVTTLHTLDLERDFGSLYTDGIRLTNSSVKLSTVPDAVFVSKESLGSGRARWLPAKKHRKDNLELTGIPDWILEVVSPSSKSKDLRWLRHAYHAAGISEYWIVDALGDSISFQILEHTPEGYVAVSEEGGWLRSAIFAHDFRLTRERGGDGLWKYVLERRENA